MHELSSNKGHISDDLEWSLRLFTYSKCDFFRTKVDMIVTDIA